MKRKKLTLYRKLYLKAERLWKESARLRDGEICQVKKLRPLVNVTHSEVLQTDHWIPRADKNFFFDIRNATVVCSTCNMHKKNKVRGVDHAITSIVMEREGGEAAGMMLEGHQRGLPNYHFKHIWWLESVIKELETCKNILELNQRGDK